MAKKLWGGRFSKKTDPLVEEFTKSIQYDYKIAEFDLFGSMIHVNVLKKSGYLTSEEAARLTKALSSIFDALERKTFKFDQKNEDIHTNIQNELQKMVGNLALKLQTARSRNEQVVFATKLYSKLALFVLGIDIAKLIETIEVLANKDRHIILPGFTHMQHAQPVYLKDYLFAYIEMLKRDNKRLECISRNLQISMGSGAMAGTPIDVTKYKGGISLFLKNYKYFTEKFNIEATSNSLDSVSDRDFIIEIISSLSILAMHLSRLSEDLIIWSTKEFDFIEIDDSFCTGSSLMPQKKNPDVLELIRGNTGKLYGNLVSVLTMMKGLPLTYNRDMQLDKEPLFNSMEIVSNELKILRGLIRTLKFNKSKINQYLEDESLYATDLAHYLVEQGVAFSDAHKIIGNLVKFSLNKNKKIKEMNDQELNKFSKFLNTKIIKKLMDPVYSVNSKKSIKRGRKK